MRSRVLWLNHNTSVKGINLNQMCPYPKSESFRNGDNRSFTFVHKADKILETQRGAAKKKKFSLEFNPKNTK